MYASDGIGLAAPQVGVNKRLMVFNELGAPDQKEHEMVLVNPSIVSKSEEKASGEEGCLSFPQIYGYVSRHKWIEVEYQNLDGNKIVKRFEDKPSVIFQHEYDHLDKVGELLVYDVRHFDFIICTVIRCCLLIDLETRTKKSIGNY